MSTTLSQLRRRVAGTWLLPINTSTRTSDTKKRWAVRFYLCVYVCVLGFFFSSLSALFFYLKARSINRKKREKKQSACFGVILDLLLTACKSIKLSSKSGFLNLSTFWAKLFFVVGGCSMYCRMFSSVHGLYPLDTSSISHL